MLGAAENLKISEVAAEEAAIAREQAATAHLGVRAAGVGRLSAMNERYQLRVAFTDADVRRDVGPPAHEVCSAVDEIASLLTVEAEDGTT